VSHRLGSENYEVEAKVSLDIELIQILERQMQLCTTACTALLWMTITVAVVIALVVD